jgi:hypothetical protein
MSTIFIFKQSCSDFVSDIVHRLCFGHEKDPLNLNEKMAENFLF